MPIMTLALTCHSRTCDCFGLNSIMCMTAHGIMTERSCRYVCCKGRSWVNIFI